MYELLKSIAKKLFPNLLTTHEETLRKMLTWRYRGTRYQCNICKTTLASFINRKNGDRLCPKCGSVGRTRRLYSILTDSGSKKRVLHFSPPKCLKSRLGHYTTYDYSTTDYEGEFDADHRYDITAIDSKDNQFDLIICYHVLEHIERDTQAMSELYRILKPSGCVLIQTPFKEGALFEDYTIKSKEERLLHYGQADHVRIYNVQTLVQRLGEVGFHVQVDNYKAKSENYYGFKISEQVITAIKKI